MKSCLKSAGSVCLGEAKKLLQNSRTGGGGGHQHECQANFSGSSGAMDAAGLLAIFQRSIEKHSARYVEFLGDGDSKAHKKLVEEEVYGEVPVENLECVGHVQECLGSRLRSLKKRLGKTPLQDGKSIGGTVRLTNSKIDKLQVYYGKAITDNTHDIETMKKAVKAIWHHTKSTDENPNHNLCPTGTDSWCGFQRDLENAHQTTSMTIQFQRLLLMSSIQPLKL